MNRVYCLFILLVFCAKLSAQSTSIQLSGIVVNAENNQALENVNISISEIVTKGTATDDQGKFTIEVDSLPVHLVFSSIGFETQKVLIKDQSEILLSLIASSTALPEIVVSAKRKVDTVYHEPYSVVDYVFKEDYLILLVFKNSFGEYDLVLLDEEEQLVDKIELKGEKPTSLFKSCLDILYLNTYYGVYKIETDETSIRLGERVKVDQFEFIIQPCILAMDSLLFFQRYHYQGQILKYYVLVNKPEQTDSLVILPLIVDQDQIIRLAEQTGNRLPWSGDFWDENISDGLRQLRDGPYVLKGVMRMFYPKLYAPIVKKDSTICLFNHFASKIQYFDIKGNQLKEVPIQYHKMKRWKKYILYDEFRQEAYTAFHTRWGEYICQVDLETGALSEAIPLELDFIEKVSIRDGVMYFLHKHDYKGARNRTIQKVRVN